MNRTRATVLGMLLLAALPPSARARDERSALAGKAREILDKHCFSCHGAGGKAEAGIFVLELERLVARKKLVRGDAARSKVYTTTREGNMPPDGKPSLTAGELETFRKWIEAGAPEFAAAPPKRPFITDKMVAKSIQDDLKTLNPREHRTYRYLTLTHLYNAGISDDDLQGYRAALAKLVNSLSWGKAIVLPAAVDGAKTIYRIKLDDYEWTADTWKVLAAFYPYGVRLSTPEARYLELRTETPVPYLRGDWFVFAAARPPLYHEILGIPTKDVELEKKLGLDVRDNIARDRVARAGFNASGVSRNNRLLERHASPYGAYWKSYDFGSNDGRKNLFKHPLGPGGKDSFEADGGEIIFNLPNGLQGYMLTDGQGRRINEGPTKVVSVKNSNRPEVINGISCMQCHRKGMIDKDDQIRKAVEESAGFTNAEKEDVKHLYPVKATFDRFLKEDAGRFLGAVKKVGDTSLKTDVVVLLSNRFEEELDLKLAAAELGVPPERLKFALRKSRELGKSLAALGAEGGTVKRDTFVDVFPSAVRDLDLGTHLTPSRFSKLLAGGPSDPPEEKIDLSPVRKRRDTARDVRNSIGMILVPVAPGRFVMGAPGSPGRRDDKQHNVTIKDGFLMGVYEVTQEEYGKVMGNNPSAFSKDGARRAAVGGLDTRSFPVETVTYEDAVEFCKKLSALDKEKAAGRSYRLPTEAEWEYACREGKPTTTLFHFGPALAATDANFDCRDPFGGGAKGDPLGRSCAAGSFSDNEFGLCDMHGNVREWCHDWYDRDYYAEGPETNPTGPKTGRARVVRGGSWYDSGKDCRSTLRGSLDPRKANEYTGFRVVCVIAK